jgi:SPP1 gp7 family putative phage head morphogenesis protein
MLVFKSRRRKDPTAGPGLTNSERRVMSTLARAMEEAREQAYQDDGEVISAITHGSADRIANLIPSRPYLEKQGSIAEELLGEVLSAAQRTEIPQGRMSVAFRFDAERTDAARWAEKEAGLMIKEIIEEQRNVVKDYISRSMMGEFTPQDVARGLRDTIGLTSQQAGWVENFRQREITAGLERGLDLRAAVIAAEKPTERYHDRIHRYRTETIARTEILRANTEGRREAWQQGVEEGYIDPSWLKQWVTGQDERVCEICEPLDGETAPVLGDFPGGDPPAHPNCRCTLNLVPAEELETFDDLTDDELEALIFDLMDGEVEDVTPATDIEDDINDIVADGELPEWAVEAGLDDLIAALPEDRSMIGFRLETDEQMTRRWEEENYHGSRFLPEGLRNMTDRYGSISDLREQQENLMEGVMELNERINTQQLSDDERAVLMQRRDTLTETITTLGDQIDRVEEREQMEAYFAQLKEDNPNWLSSMERLTVFDVDEITGKPGAVMMEHLRIVKAIGAAIDDEAWRRTGTPEWRTMDTSMMSLRTRDAIATARESVLAELRPTDERADNWIPLKDEQEIRTFRVLAGPRYSFDAANEQTMDAVGRSLFSFPTTWLDAVKEQQGEIRVGFGDRGFSFTNQPLIVVSGRTSLELDAQGKTQPAGIIPSSVESVARHEMGHRMQSAVPGLSAIEYAYLWERTGGEGFGSKQLIPLTRDEYYISNSTFGNAYTARIYDRDPDALIARFVADQKFTSEVFTTGLQATFPRDSGDARYQDLTGHGFSEWTLGVLGSL